MLRKIPNPKFQVPTVLDLAVGSWDLGFALWYASRLEHVHILPRQVDILAAKLDRFEDTGGLAQFIPCFDGQDLPPRAQRPYQVIFVKLPALPVSKDTASAPELRIAKTGTHLRNGEACIDIEAGRSGPPVV